MDNTALSRREISPLKKPIVLWLDVHTGPLQNSETIDARHGIGGIASSVREPRHERNKLSIRPRDQRDGEVGVDTISCDDRRQKRTNIIHRKLRSYQYVGQKIAETVIATRYRRVT